MLPGCVARAHVMNIVECTAWLTPRYAWGYRDGINRWEYHHQGNALNAEHKQTLASLLTLGMSGTLTISISGTACRLSTSHHRSWLLSSVQPGGRPPQQAGANSASINSDADITGKTEDGDCLSAI